ncbi:unnamed protein product [Rotaria sp. Silwood1]|nr:unnamed protein product [Rotaria sp. Silwood1]CAF4794550.1 unnamed protein product [Rotaria sp. Silwood1]
MASSSRPCVVNQCKRPSRALCNCCQQYFCREHLKEHDDLMNAQLPSLADHINELSDQFNNGALLEPTGLTGLKQWREEAHKTVDQFYERKSRQFEQFIQERKDKQRKNLNQMRINMNELIQEQETTQEQINSMKESIQFLEQDIHNLQQVQFNISPLVINDNLIYIPQEIMSQDRLFIASSRHTKQSTSDKISNNDNHISTQQKRNLGFGGKQNTGFFSNQSFVLGTMPNCILLFS